MVVDNFALLTKEFSRIYSGIRPLTSLASFDSAVKRGEGEREGQTRGRRGCVRRRAGGRDTQEKGRNAENLDGGRRNVVGGKGVELVREGEEGKRGGDGEKGKEGGEEEKGGFRPADKPDLQPSTWEKKG